MKGDDTEDDWIAKRVAAAAASLDEKLPMETTDLLKIELRSTMSQRPLKQSELTDLASRLLGLTVSKDGEEAEK
ncbi:hypothetical protein [Lentisalinibacter sediminis]|uniref:hypothetical protein n=1 Tax=Lentisalinibacter sediminis TaxID=2992237 RepID=UPI00386FC3FB